MPGFLLTMSVSAMCVHGGQGKPAAPNPRVKVAGTPVPMSAPPFAIAGCAMVTPVGAPAPCVVGNALPPTLTLRVKSMGQGLLCQSTQILAVNPMTGPAPLQIAFAGQVKVKAQ